MVLLLNAAFTWTAVTSMIEGRERMGPPTINAGPDASSVTQIVQRLVDIGVLREFTGQARHRRFRYDAYVRLFEEGE